MEEQSLVEPKKTIKLFTRKQKISPPRAGKVIRLGRNERTIPFAPDVVREMFSRISGEDLVAYPESEPLYTQLSTWLSVPRDRLLIFNGSDAAIKALFEVYIGEGDEVLSLFPAYHGYTLYSRMYGATLHLVKYDAHLKFDQDKFLACIMPTTRLVIVANPDAVGDPIEPDYLQCILQKAASVGAVVLVDEAYYHFGEYTVASQTDHFGNLVVTRSFSKAFGIAGVRLGFLIAHPRMIQELSKVRLNYEISAITVKIGQFLLERSDLMQEYVESVKQSRAKFAECMRQLGLLTHASTANFVMVRLPEHLDVAGFVAHCMAQASIELNGRFDAPLEQYIRVTIGPWTQMQRLVDLTHAYLRDHPVPGCQDNLGRE